MRFLDAVKAKIVRRLSPLGVETTQWGLCYTYPDGSEVFEKRPSRDSAIEIQKIHENLDRSFTVEVVSRRIIHYAWQNEE